MDENIDMYIDVTPDGQIPPKVQLHAGLMPQAENEKDQKKIFDFMDRITDEQAAQLLALDGFTEPIKIPIWDADLGGPAKDAARDHDTPPDRFIDGTTAPRNIIDDMFLLIHAARNFLDIGTQIETLGKLYKQNKAYWAELQKIFPPSYGGRRLKKVSLPVDYLDKDYIWSQKEAGNFKNRIRDLNRSTKETYTRCIINFDALGDLDVVKKLDHTDEALYTAAANLWISGNECFSLSALYELYHKSTPHGGETEEISNRLLKTAKTWLELDNKDESEVTKYPYFTYEGSLLPLERVTCYINGKLVEQAIHLLREPPLFTYARERGALVTVDRKYLSPPLNSSEKTDRLNIYLLRIIAIAKKDSKIKNRITFKKVFDEMDVKRDFPRFKGYMKRLFEFYKEGGFIKSYEQDKNGINFFW